MQVENCAVENIEYVVGDNLQTFVAVETIEDLFDFLLDTLV